jgi:hypothetical protein
MLHAGVCNKVSAGGCECRVLRASESIDRKCKKVEGHSDWSERQISREDIRRTSIDYNVC